VHDMKPTVRGAVYARRPFGRPLRRFPIGFAPLLVVLGFVALASSGPYFLFFPLVPLFFLLAFFIHESSAGTSARWAGRKPNGTTTHNVGNIVCTTGWRCHGRFRDYASWEAGIEDWYRLIRDLYIGEWGRTTVEAIIPKYAPASDNNDEARYIGQVRTMVEGWRNN